VKPTKTVTTEMLRLAVAARKRRKMTPTVLPWRPNPGGQQMVVDLVENTNVDQIYYLGCAGGGKRLAVDTPVPTPTGWTTMGDLVAGDTVFGESGAPCAVTFAHRVAMSKDSYRLTFDDGSEIVADAEHLWLTYNAKELGTQFRFTDEGRAARNKKRSPVPVEDRQKSYERKSKAVPSRGTVRTTAEIAATLRVRGGNRANHAIPVAKSLQLPPRHLPLYPYLLGVWLGDGTTTDGRITSADAQIFDTFSECGFSIGSMRAKKGNAAATATILGLVGILRRIGVLGHKHVPSAYLRSSREQRLELLRGLMDTDGTVAKASGSAEFCTTSPELADGVHELIVSLGWKVRKRVGRARLYGRDCGPKWMFRWMPTEYVFRLGRKRSLQRLATRRTRDFRYVVACNPIPPVQMRCITVDSPSHLYLAGRDMVPTHNSWLAIGLALTHFRNAIIFRKEYTDLTGADGIVEKSRRVYSQYGRYNGNEHMWRLRFAGRDRFVEFGGCQTERDREARQGRANDLYCFDEITQFMPSIPDYITGWRRAIDAEGGRTLELYTGNPPVSAEGEWVVDRIRAWVDPTHVNPAKEGEIRYFVQKKDGYEIEVDSPMPVEVDGELKRPKSRAFVMSRLIENPTYADGEYARILDAMPEPLRSILKNGDFFAGRKDGAYQTIPTAWIDAAMDRWRPVVPDVPLSCIGIDVARGGDDETVLAPRYGEWFAELAVYSGKQTPNGEAIASLAVPLMLKGDYAYVAVDADGVGASAVDILRGYKIPVAAVSFGSGAKRLDGEDKTDRSKIIKFANLRAYSYWKIREALDPANGMNIALPRDKRLRADLAAPRYIYRNSRMLLEDKDAIRKRLGRSPDRGDAVAMTFADVPPRAWKASDAVFGGTIYGEDLPIWDSLAMDPVESMDGMFN